MNENTSTLADITLVWDDSYWRGDIQDLGLFGKYIELHVETEDEEETHPHLLQTEAWKSISGNRSQYFDLIRDGLFRYYCDIRPRYEQAGPEWIANMPVLTKKEGIDALLTLNYISIGWPHDESAPNIGFSYSCQWDREHGAGIILNGHKVVDVGGADCLLCS